MRLIDELRAGATVYTPDLVRGAVRSAWRDYVQGPTGPLVAMNDPNLAVVMIDNVAEYYYAGTDQEDWDFNRDFPNVAPPWPAAWYEYRYPRLFRSKSHGELKMDHLRLRVGVLIRAVKRGALPVFAAKYEWPPDTAWIMQAEQFIEEDGKALGPAAVWMYEVAEDGRIKGQPLVATPGGDKPNPEKQEAFFTLATVGYPVLLAISFLHCKNVTVEEHKVDAPLAKKFERRSGLKPCAYKTLVIEPLKATLRKEGNAEKTGLRKALHICRGHFADYTEGRGLFGKLHGRFWMPMHVRGPRESTDEQPPAREIEVRTTGLVQK